jgi:hypothetical protein
MENAAAPCVTVSVSPATAIEPDRLLAAVFAATEYLTVPLPLPEPPLEIVSQLLLLAAVQEHPAAAVTLTV